MNTEALTNYTGGFIALIIIGIVLFIVLMDGGKKAEIDKKIEELANNTLEMTPEEFFKMRKTSFDSHHSSYAMKKNFAGVYILFNQSKSMYYVGQGKQVFNRVNAHFTGKAMVTFMLITNMATNSR